MAGAHDAKRQRVRQERSQAILISTGDRLNRPVLGRLPASDVGNAIAYTHQRWRQLNRFLKHGWLRIDNNLAENALRPSAIGHRPEELVVRRIARVRWRPGRRVPHPRSSRG